MSLPRAVLESWNITNARRRRLERVTIRDSSSMTLRRGNSGQCMTVERLLACYLLDLLVLPLENT